MCQQSNDAEVERERGKLINMLDRQIGDKRLTSYAGYRLYNSAEGGRSGGGLSFLGSSSLRQHVLPFAPTWQRVNVNFHCTCRRKVSCWQPAENFLLPFAADKESCQLQEANISSCNLCYCRWWCNCNCNSCHLTLQTLVTQAPAACAT